MSDKKIAYLDKKKTNISKIIIKRIISFCIFFEHFYSQLL